MNMTPQDRYEQRTSILLAGVGGGVDAVGYLTFSHLFMGFMTGNTVYLGINLGQQNWQQAGRDLFPILMFLLGAVLGSVLTKKVVPALVLEAVLLAATLCWQVLAPESLSVPAAAYHAKSPPAWFSTNPAGYFFPGVFLLATAMGIQSGLFRRVGNQSIGVTAVTGDVLGFASLLASGFTKKGAAPGGEKGHELSVAERWGTVSGIWLTYVLGALVAGWSVERHARGGLLFPLVLLVVAIALSIPRSSGKPA